MRNITFYKSKTDGHKFSMHTMNQRPMKLEDIGKEIVKQTEGVLTEAYKDVVSPSAQPIGAVLSLLPRTLRLFFQKWEKWIINGEESLKLTITAVKEKAERIPEETDPAKAV